MPWQGALLSAIEASAKDVRRGRPSGAPRRRQDSDVASPAYRILLLEDDAVDVRLIRACLAAIEPLTLSCEVVTSVGMARERLKEDSFDLCITDFWLGFESSLRFVAELTRPEIAIPVIVLTSLSTPEIRRLCLQAGATSVVGKEHLSPGVIETAIGEAMLDGGAAEDAAGGQGGPRQDDRTFVDRFAGVMGRLNGARTPADPAPSEGLLGSAGDPMRTFAALSETARFAVLEQVVAEHGPSPRGVSAAEADQRTDLLEAVRNGCGLVEARGWSIALHGPARSATVACAEAATIFIALELLNRVGELTGDNGTLTVEVVPEEGGCTLRVSGPVYGGTPALPVTFGSLFTCILACCHGVVEMVHDTGLSITLVARFADAPGLLANLPPQ